jgi:hypothetical protein
VAHQTALQARRTAARRRAREKQVREMPEPAVVEQDLWRDLRPLLDQELSCLPDAYREVVVLSDLEGKTRKEVARQLGLPEGTVGSRLARARTILSKRLARHGLAVSGGALAAALSQRAASAGVPALVVSSTIRAATLIATGQAAAEGAVTAKVAALTEGVVRVMLFTKLKSVVAVVLVLGFILTGATALCCRTAPAQGDKKPTAEKAVEPEAKQQKEVFTAWGKEVGGLQAGLGFRPGECRAYHVGETVRLVIRVRNVGKKEVRFSYFNEFFYENPPAVTDGEGKPLLLEGAGLSGWPVLVERNLAPGKEVNLCEMNLKLLPASERDKERPVWTLFGTGRFRLQHENVGGGNIGTGEIKFDPVLSKLATGKLELEVKDAEQLPEKKEEKEGFTAWGQEVGGLQAGLGLRYGERRAYDHGETVTLVVRACNVGKEEVKFQYLKEFFDETPPTVTDADGKTVSQLNMEAGGLVHVPKEVSLAPGKVIELASKYGGASGVRYELRPASEREKPTTGKGTPLYGTGKVSPTSAVRTVLALFSALLSS